MFVGAAEAALAAFRRSYRVRAVLPGCDPAPRGIQVGAEAPQPLVPLLLWECEMQERWLQHAASSHGTVWFAV